LKDLYITVEGITSLVRNSPTLALYFGGAKDIDTELRKIIGSRIRFNDGYSTFNPASVWDCVSRQEPFKHRFPHW